jgi:hypothetical protein
MFYPVSSQLGAPVTQPKSETIAQPLASYACKHYANAAANHLWISACRNDRSSHKYEENGAQNSISHPRYAPSSVSSEEFLVARAGMAPVYNHNMAATREARTSNLHEDMPRFRDQIDLLA